MATGNKIEINAGSGGKIKKMTVAAIVDGGVNNEVSGTPKEDKEEKDGNDHFVINGPSGNIEIDEIKMMGRVKGGMDNKVVNPQKEAKAEDSKREEVSMVMENVTADDLDGLQ